MVWGSREGPFSSSPSLDGFLCNGISVSSPNNLVLLVPVSQQFCLLSVGQ